MKKRITLFAAALVVANFVVNAVPAKPGVMKLTQPDGTVVEAEIFGDETFHYYESIHGELLMRDCSGVLRPAVVKPDGSIVGEGIISGKATDTARRAEFMRAVRLKSAELSKEQSVARVAPQKIKLSFPTTGMVTGLIVLCEFQDVKFSEGGTREHFFEKCNTEGYSSESTYGSVIDYFKAQSAGQFTPSFDVVGPVTLPYDRAHYGITNDVDNLFRDAALAADAAGLDFTKYDINEDGFVDFFFVIFAGHGQAQGGPYDSVWPAMKDMTNYVFDYFDGMNLGVSACSCELKGGSGSNLDGVGTICHEFSHILGLADIYDTSSQGGHGMSHYDIMDIGTYNDNQITPSGYTAMDKYTLGWIEPEVLEESCKDITLEPFETSHKAYFIVNPDNTNEYYTLENRQQQGWDKGIPGHGLVISYCHYVPSLWRRNTVNAAAAGYEHVAIVAADNIWSATIADEANDPYPSAFGNTSFTATSTPAAKWYSSNTALKSGISNIRESEDGIITFDFDSGKAGIDNVPVGGNRVTVAGNSIIAPSDAVVMTIAGRRVRPTCLESGIYLVRTAEGTVKVAVK